MSDRRHPVQPFQPNLIREFLGERSLVSQERFTSGRSNTSYKLELSDGSLCVFKMYAQGNPEQDAYIYHLVQGVVPVPDLLDRGPNWAVLTFLPGRLLSQVPEGVGEAAVAIARIASIHFDASGQLNPDGSISAFSFGGLSGFMTQQLDDSDVQQWLGPDTFKKVQRILNQESQRLAELDAESCFVHGDFNPSNILIDQGQVSGVLDWDYSHAGTPYMDIGNLLRHTPTEQYSQIKLGLERGDMTLSLDWQQRAQLIDFASQLEFLTSSRADAFKQQCVDRIDQFVYDFASR